ncbi:hypothetical protein K502DRAFT_342778 [Neoconidiobolus thromboides FSU 785]|nr:hypothetical protein K502DRAFT_342778 [Neoconidiobolus thromboides FSU 785]
MSNNQNILIDAINQNSLKWKEFNLQSQQLDLEEYNQQILEENEQVKNSRKQLAEKTKEFRKLRDEEKLIQLKQLLKGYQEEIDNLTKKNKSKESKLLTFYQHMLELTDPVPIFNKINEELKDNLTLKRQADEYKKKNEELSLELTLEKKKQGEFDTILINQIAQKEYSLKSEMEIQQREHLLKESEMKKEIDNLNQQLNFINKNQALKQQQLIESFNMENEKADNQMSQLEFIMNQMEEIKDQNYQLSRENENLKKTLNENNNDINNKIEREVVNGDNTIIVKELNNKIENQAIEINNLIKEIEKHQSQFNKNKQLNEQSIIELKDQLNTQIQQNQNLSEKLNSMKDYEQIKKELNLLKDIEFPEYKEDTDMTSSPTENIDSKEEILQKMVKKQQQLQNESIKYKNELKNQEKENQINKELIIQKDELIIQKEKLIKKLEQDLVTLNNQNNQSDNDNDKSNLPLSPTINNNKEHLIPILSQQRDRYRSRNMELEEEIRKIMEQKKEMDYQYQELNLENMKLYEQIKYQKQYSNQEGSKSSGNRGNDYAMIDMHGVNKKYDQMLDDRENPFVKFKLKEENRRYQTLNSMDRLALSITKLFLTNYITRAILLCYLLCLHALILILIYNFIQINDEK